MAELSAGIAVWRYVDDRVEVLLCHMGGPYWRQKDDGAWSIPKGLPRPDEEPLAAARREFIEELGIPLPPVKLVPLGEIRQSSKKRVVVWSLKLEVPINIDLSGAKSNTFDLEWPPRSGRIRSFPEIDRVAWYGLPVARTKMIPGQVPILNRLPGVSK